MNQHQPSSTGEQPSTSSDSPEPPEDLTSGKQYDEYVTGILRQHLPRLKRALERRHGDMLDRWLDAGGLTDAAWKVEGDFRANSLSVKSLLKETVQRGVEKEQIVLGVAESESWKPIKIDYLLEHIYDECVEEIEQFIIASIMRALQSAPTEEAERELIEVVSGKRRVGKPYIRKEAVLTLTFTEFLQVLPRQALMRMRYGEEGNRGEFFTEMDEGEISSVWRVIKDELPEDVAQLICKDGSF